jgi:flagella basal body P-ring formation protein FlgA
MEAMTQSARLKTLLCFLVVVAANFSAEAVEIRLKSDCVVSGPLVRLGDVADVLNCDEKQAAELSLVELFPTPAMVRFVRAGEVRELLTLHGLDDVKCRFSGATVVAVYPNVRNVGASEVRQGDDTHQREPVNAAAARRTRQRVERANVPPPELVVVAVRPLRRGELVGESDVTLAEASRAGTALRRVEDAVGRELIRAIEAGQPIDEKSVRPPVLVKRGEIVTVMAYAAGVRVRTTAVARDEGSLGDLIAVQTLDRKQQYMARVAAFQVVEVYAGGPRVGPESNRQE